MTAKHAKKPIADIPPDGPKDLAGKAVDTGAANDDKAAVARAEQALRQLSVEFEQWIIEEVETLTEAHNEVLQHGLTPPYSEQLYAAAHDLKGQAETLGYPLIGQYCALICKMFEAVDDHGKIPVHAVTSHVDAIKVALREDIRDRENSTANNVFEKLCDVVLEFYDHHTAAKGPQDTSH